MSSTKLNRADLAAIFPGNTKAQRAFEDIQSNATIGATTGAQNVESTQALQDATVITLSPNDAFNRERVLNVGQGLSLIDRGASVDLLLNFNLMLNGSKNITLNLLADTTLDLPATGRVPSSSDGPYSSDSDAASHGIQIGQIYKTSAGGLAWRQT